MNKYVFLIIVGILGIILLIFTIYKTITENFTNDNKQNYDDSQDIFIRKSRNFDTLENNTYMNDYNTAVDTSMVSLFEYRGPKWKNEFDYENSVVMQAECQRDKLLEFIRNFEHDTDYKTYPSLNNTTFCGGTANRCTTASDCCGGKNCFDSQCSF